MFIPTPLKQMPRKILPCLLASLGNGSLPTCDGVAAMALNVLVSVWYVLSKLLWGGEKENTYAHFGEAFANGNLSGYPGFDPKKDFRGVLGFSQSVQSTW